MTAELLLGSGSGEYQVLIQQVTKEKQQWPKPRLCYLPTGPPKEGGLCGVLHLGPSAPKDHWALRFAFLLLQLCWNQLITSICPEAIQIFLWVCSTLSVRHVKDSAPVLRLMRHLFHRSSCHTLYPTAAVAVFISPNFTLCQLYFLEGSYRHLHWFASCCVGKSVGCWCHRLKLFPTSANRDKHHLHCLPPI